MESPATILIIDDDDQLCQVLKAFFRVKGIEAFTFLEPPEDLKTRLTELQADAILLDVVLPRASGIDILSKIKRIDDQLPVIMMTGLADYESNLDALRKGAYAYLTKPFPSLEEIFHTTNNAVRYHRELLKTRHLSEEIEKKLRLEQLNILELEFLKSLNRLIGETEEPATVLKNAFSLLTSFLSFDIFAALIPFENEVAIHIYSNASVDKNDAEFVSKRLLERMSDLLKDGKVPKVLLNSQAESIGPATKDFSHVISALSSRNKLCGYAGLFRVSPFPTDDEIIFRRFCAHISSTLEKISLFQEIKSLSIHDGLTGIYNHMFLIKKLDEEVERAKRYDAKFSAILFDIDDFKSVNDTYGHPAGDFVLGRVAEILRDGLRGIDIAGRYGGEEFLLILPETEGDRAYATAERLRRSIADTAFKFENSQIRITISGGVATYRDGIDAKTLLMTADNNLYVSKKKGKNRTFYEEL